MHRWFLIATLLLAGCGKKNKPAAAEDDGEAYSGGFVEITIDDDVDEMIGSELMMATAECGDLVRLEPAAIMGKLEDGEIRCLDDSLRNAERQTIKDKISRVLLSDAWAKGDGHRWEHIARRHLAEIDRSDPDLCYKFALHVSKKEKPEDMDEAMKWADVALENRTRWSGDLFVKRVYALYQLKAVAAMTKWNYLEEQDISAPSETSREEADETRNMTKTYAREWLEFARSSGKDPTVAMQICVSASGTDGFCDET